MNFDVNKVNTTPAIRNDTIRIYLSLEPLDHPPILCNFPHIIVKILALFPSNK